MDKLKHIAEMGEFIPHGDDSFIDDVGITNRWAERRRIRRAQQQNVRPPNEIYNTNNPEVLEAIRLEQERMNRLLRAAEETAAARAAADYQRELEHHRAWHGNPEERSRDRGG